MRYHTPLSSIQKKHFVYSLQLIGESGGRDKKGGKKVQVKGKMHARICGERKIKYDGMKTASYKLNLLTIIELFHLANKMDALCK